MFCFEKMIGAYLKKSFPFSLLALIWITIGMIALHDTSNSLKPDSSGYLKLATNLRIHHVFSSDIDPPFRAETIRVPGYPIFIAVFQKLFNSPIRPIIIIQMVSSFLALLFMMRLPMIYGVKQGIKSIALIWGVDIVYLFHAPIILSESVFIFIFVLALLAIVSAVKSISFWRICLAGVLTGITMLIRPVAIFFPFFISLIFWRKKPFIIVFLVFSYALPSLWAIRNYYFSGYFQLSSQGGYDLLRYPASSILALKNGTYRADEELNLRQKIDTSYGKAWPSETVRSVEYGKVAFQIIRSDFYLALKFHMFGVIRILFGPGLELLVDFFVSDKGAFFADNTNSESISGKGTFALLKRYRWLIPFFSLYIITLSIVYVFYLIGVRSLILRGFFAISYLLITGPIYFLLVSSHQGYYRYRIPILPFIMVGAAFGIDSIKKIKA